VAAARRTRRAWPQRRRSDPRSHAAPNFPGTHALADHLARRLVRDADVHDTDLVLDIGAGLGAVTRPLAGTGARVIAIERDERTARRLATRTAALPNVTVITGDALAVPLPNRPYLVVSNIPFAITMALLRRLVDSRMLAADLVVELRTGRRLAAAAAGRRDLARWHRRFAFSLGPVIPAHGFHPPPSVDAVVLRLRRHRGRAL
jgi:23S rRNA (adenine-N6)-dimethyltransferase